MPGLRSADAEPAPGADEHPAHRPASPAVHFKLTPPGENLPTVAPGSTTPNWPVVPFQVVRQRTLDFLGASHAQAAVNVHFFAPFPVPGGSTQSAYAYVIGLAASRGKVFSGFDVARPELRHRRQLARPQHRPVEQGEHRPSSSRLRGRKAGPRGCRAVEHPRRLRPEPDERRQDDPGVHGRHPSQRAADPGADSSARSAAAHVHARGKALVRPEQRAHGHRRHRRTGRRWSCSPSTAPTAAMACRWERWPTSSRTTTAW